MLQRLLFLLRLRRSFPLRTPSFLEESKEGCPPSSWRNVRSQLEKRQILGTLKFSPSLSLTLFSLSRTQEDSGNAAADGNFSIQVLTKALEVWNLTCTPVMSHAAGQAWQEPHRETAFLCNLDQHWFTVRRCSVASPTVHATGSCWWNFNSMFPAPQPISELYLGAFLAQLREEGYSIFVVRGVLPAESGMAGNGGEYGHWCTAAEAVAANKQAEAIKAAGRARNAAEQAMARVGASGSSTLQVQRFGAGGSHSGPGDMDDDAELQAAIAASLGGAGGGGGGGGHDDELARALVASLASAPPPEGVKDSADADLAAAIAASLADPVHGGGGQAMAAILVPDEPGAGEPGTVMLAFRVPSGARLQRRFRDGDSIGGVVAYVATVSGIDMSRHVLTTAFPRRQLRELGMTLKDAGVKDKEALSVEPSNTR